MHTITDRECGYQIRCIFHVKVEDLRDVEQIKEDERRNENQRNVTKIRDGHPHRIEKYVEGQKDNKCI